MTLDSSCLPNHTLTMDYASSGQFSESAKVPPPTTSKASYQQPFFKLSNLDTPTLPAEFPQGDLSHPSHFIYPSEEFHFTSSSTWTTDLFGTDSNSLTESWKSTSNSVHHTNCDKVSENINNGVKSNNNGNNTKKRKSGKSSYKHVPHHQKPVHLVAKRNARERKRVQAVNLAFVRLRKCVPVENRNKRLSKVKTLHRAIEYIDGLQRLLQESDEMMMMATATNSSSESSKASLDHSSTSEECSELQLSASSMVINQVGADGSVAGTNGGYLMGHQPHQCHQCHHCETHHNLEHHHHHQHEQHQHHHHQIMMMSSGTLHSTPLTKHTANSTDKENYYFSSNKAITLN